MILFFCQPRLPKNLKGYLKLRSLQYFTWKKKLSSSSLVLQGSAWIKNNVHVIP